MSNVDTLKYHLKRQLDPDQYDIATTRTNIRYRRVKGPAGSGKSLTIAARAAILACEGKQVLVCSHNITLYNMLKSLVERYIPEEVSRQIIFTNFHAWCKDVCEKTGYRSYYSRLWKHPKEIVWKSTMAKLVSDIYDNRLNNSNFPFYDAILVDEGQDYEIFWWQTLRRAVIENGEMLLVADKTQNIRGTAQAWTEKSMEDCGFSGPWKRLEKSYRLPDRIIPILRDFLNQFPYEGEIDPPPEERDKQTNLFDKFRWVQVSGSSLVDTCIKEIEYLYNDSDIPTVYFLSGKNIGMPVANQFKQRGVRILSTHSKNSRESREQKVNLHPDCAEICATTVDSFKGWETPHLVVHIDSIQSDTDRARFYTALSRLHKHSKGSVLTIVSSCSEPELEQFGRKHFHDFDPPILDTPGFDFQVNAIPF